MKSLLTKTICVLLAIIILSVSLVACTKDAEEVAGTTAEQSTGTTVATTVTTTTPRTTEDVNTTFAEDETAVIYDGLGKDKDGSYPYLLATYTTYYNAGDTTRTANLKAAVGKIDNIKIPKDKVFSFNQTVGKRTITAGYSSAKVIANGEFVDGLGGGVCQVSSTVFECVLRANVEIVKRTYHTLKITYVPLGGDATVQWNSKDFQFKNTVGCDVRLNMTCSDGKLTCNLYGTEDIDVGDVQINISSYNGTYTLTRTVDGVQNYSTNSTYQSPKPSTTKKKKETTTKKKKADKTNKDKKESTTKKKKKS